MRFLVFLLSAVLCASCGSSGGSAHPVVQTSAAHFLVDTKSWTMKSATSGRTYEISIGLPAGYNKEHVPYPVLYAADANAEFGTFVEAARGLSFGRLIPDIVVVGIGYVNAGQAFVAANAPRTFDLTPTPDPTWVAASAKDSLARGLSVPTESGGAPSFLKFIRDELVPWIEGGWNVSHSDRAWFGHSFGGLLGLYALFHNGGLFQRFVIGSPSIRWNQRSILSDEKAFAATGKPLRVRAFFAVGSEEEKEFATYAMVSNLLMLVETLKSRKYQGFEFQSHIFEGESHVSVIPATVSRGLRSIYSENPARR
jgi:predicted alpha/beta superfamily hydrolase